MPESIDAEFGLDLEAPDTPKTGKGKSGSKSAGSSAAGSSSVREAKSNSSLRAVLDEIGAEESVARLESRVESLEGELERSDRRLHEFERARRGELDVMRARVEDVLSAVDEMMGEQRAATKDLEGRVQTQMQDSTTTARAELHELRDVLTPRVQQAVHEAESQVSALRGEYSRFSQEVATKLDEGKESMVSLEKRVEDVRRATDRNVVEGFEGQAKKLASLQAEVTARLDAVETSGEARQQDAATRLEALRRELDAATGELRAAVSLRAAELKSDLQAVRDELSEAADVGQSRDDDLETRWIDATRDVADKIELAVTRVEGQVRKEREERLTSVDRAEERLTEAMNRLDALGDRIEAVKRPKVDDVRRGMTDVESRVEALQGQVAAAVGQIASDLNNKVSVVGGDVDAVRATAAFHTEELARLGGVSDSVDELRAEFANAVGQIRQELAAMRQAAAGATVAPDQSEAIANAARLAEASTAQTRELVASMTNIQEELRALSGLRQEVRDQASTLVEAVTRAESAEQAAIQTREAVAAAVRRGREARAVSRANPEAPPA